MREIAGKTEVVVTYHGQGGTWRTAYRSRVLAYDGMEMTLRGEPGIVVASMYIRERKTYNHTA